MKTKDSTTSSKTKGNGKGAGGRPGKYESHVQPYLKDIKTWKRGGATDEQICEALNIGTSTYYDYQNKYEEFSEAIKRSRQMLVLDLKGELARIALPHKVRVKKTYIKKDLETGHETQHTEMQEKDVDGNISAIHLLLKNFDKDDWKNDWDNYELKQQQQKLQELIAKEKYWLSDEDLYEEK